MSIVDDHKFFLINNKLSISYNLLNKVSKNSRFYRSFIYNIFVIIFCKLNYSSKFFFNIKCIFLL